MTRDELVESVNFIFTECARLRQQITKDIKSISKQDAYYTLPSPRGGGITCGIEAHRSLEKLASYAALRGKIQQRVTIDTVRVALGRILIERFLIDRLPIDIKQVDRALNAVVNEAKKKCSDITHLVPCHLMTTKEPSEISIGPVCFMGRKSFRQLMLQKFKEEKVNQSKSNNREVTRQLLFDSMRYYRAFDWVAKIQTKGFDEQQGDKIANRAVIAGLDCIHLVLGGKFTYKMKIGGPQVLRDRRAKLVILKNKKLDPTISSRGKGQPGFPVGWSKLLLKDDVKRMLGLCGIALEAAVNPDLKRPVSRRFLDATVWYGQAIREEVHAASIVKFITALERILITEERKDIGQLLGERLSAICVLGFERESKKTRQQWFEETKKAYNLRSKLVHGSISPESSDVAVGAYSCMKLTEAALQCFLSLFGEELLREAQFNSKELACTFDLLITRADKAGSRLDPLEARASQ